MEILVRSESKMGLLDTNFHLELSIVFIEQSLNNTTTTYYENELKHKKNCFRGESEVPSLKSFNIGSGEERKEGELRTELIFNMLKLSFDSQKAARLSQNNALNVDIKPVSPSWELDGRSSNDFKKSKELFEGGVGLITHSVPGLGQTYNNCNFLIHPEKSDRILSCFCFKGNINFLLHDSSYKLQWVSITNLTMTK